MWSGVLTVEHQRADQLTDDVVDVQTTRRESSGVLPEKNVWAAAGRGFVFVAKSRLRPIPPPRRKGGSTVEVTIWSWNHPWCLIRFIFDNSRLAVDATDKEFI